MEVDENEEYSEDFCQQESVEEELLDVDGQLVVERIEESEEVKNSVEAKQPVHIQEVLVLNETQSAHEPSSFVQNQSGMRQMLT